MTDKPTSDPEASPPSSAPATAASSRRRAPGSNAPARKRIAVVAPDRLMTSAERYDWGRDRRRVASRAEQAGWTAPPGRTDPIALLESQAATRVADLVPIRHGRMMTSPFAFLRGSAIVMASDLAYLPSSGIEVQLCGDAHIANFGAFATTERNFIFDINDFDETHSGPFEWDLKRLTASIVVGGRDYGFSKGAVRDALRAGTAAYRTQANELRALPFAAAYSLSISVDSLQKEFLARAKSEAARRQARATADVIRRKALQRTSLGSLEKLAIHTGDGWQLRDAPPLVVRTGMADDIREAVLYVMNQYTDTARDELRVFINHYRIADVARKVVGVGSVGTEAFMLLAIGDGDDALFLQAKEAQQSVIAPYVDSARVVANDDIEHEGQRVVVGQRIAQAASDQFLGWATGQRGKQFYFRQLRDMKVSFDVVEVTEQRFVRQAEICARALARAHARSGSIHAIAGYIGKGDTFDRALEDWAYAYASQTVQDHAALVEAVRSGRLQATEGI